MFWVKIKRILIAGFVNFSRNAAVSLASVLVLAVTLFMVGSLVFAQALLNAAIVQVKDKVDINVYLKMDAPEEKILALKEELQKLPEVKSVEYISREAALVAFRERHKDNSPIISSLEEIGSNPLGATLNVKAKDPSQYESIARFLEPAEALGAPTANSAVNLIDKVNYAQHKLVIDRLARMINATERFGVGVSVLFALLALVVTFNTIRLAIYTAREEIAVMKLVGASNNYVRGPFVIEGIIAGVVATGLTMGLLALVSAWVGETTQNFFGGVNLYVYYLEHLFSLAALLLLAGVGIGGFSSYLAVRRYLRV